MTQFYITRPQGLAGDIIEKMANTFADKDYQFVHWPLFKIDDIEINGQAQTWLFDFDLYDYVFVASKYAANSLLQHLDERWPMLPVGPEFVCPGSATASVLSPAGFVTSYPNKKMDSEGVLALSMFTQDALAEQKKWLIVSGLGGRRKIQEVLTNNNQLVDELDLYQRIAINQLPEQKPVKDDVVIVTSLESLENIQTLLKDNKIDSAILNLWVSSERIKQQANSWKSIVVMPNALDQTIIQTVENYER